MPLYEHQVRWYPLGQRAAALICRKTVQSPKRYPAPWIQLAWAESSHVVRNFEKDENQRWEMRKVFWNILNDYNTYIFLLQMRYRKTSPTVGNPTSLCCRVGCCGLLASELGRACNVLPSLLDCCRSRLDRSVRLIVKNSHLLRSILFFLHCIEVLDCSLNDILINFLKHLVKHIIAFKFEHFESIECNHWIRYISSMLGINTAPLLHLIASCSYILMKLTFYIWFFSCFLLFLL